MIDVTYTISEEKYFLGNESIISYGIVAYSDAEKDGTLRIITSVHNITYDKNSLMKLVDDCNRLELSPIHLINVVEDFLSN